MLLSIIGELRVGTSPTPGDGDTAHRAREQLRAAGLEGELPWWCKSNAWCPAWKAPLDPKRTEERMKWCSSAACTRVVRTRNITAGRILIFGANDLGCRQAGGGSGRPSYPSCFP